MPTTKNRARAGQTTIEACVRYSIPLPDPSASGNTGREGVDDDSASRRFPNAGLARAWCEQFQAPAGTVDDARITVGRWEAQNYHADGIGLVHDAELIVETEQYGAPDDDGTWYWEDPEAVY